MKQRLLERNKYQQLELHWEEVAEQRRKERRLRKWKKRYQVHTVSNTWDFKYSVPQHFSLGGGWFIPFCACCICFQASPCHGMPDIFLSKDKSLSDWIWPGRPPESLLEHVTLASIGSAMVILAFTITTSIAIFRIRSSAKKGSTMSAIRGAARLGVSHLDKYYSSALL